MQNFKPVGYLLLILLVLANIIVCSENNVIEEKIIYDDDDRVEFYQASAAIQEHISKSIVALIPKNKLNCGSTNCVPYANTLAEAFDLCSGETFATQPTAGFCSGTLIAADKVATAGHCITSEADCLKTYFVFNYHYKSSGSLETINKARDVYECKRYFSEFPNVLGREDWAVIQLDRAVDSSVHEPASIAEEAEIELGEEIVLIGFPSGLPVKVDASATVASTDSFAFEAALDSFGGNSGSGVFRKSDLKQLGIHVSGNQDYVYSGDCVVANRVDSADYSSRNLERNNKIWHLLDRVPLECDTDSDCPDNVECLTDGATGFCATESNVCPGTCEARHTSCCFSGNSVYGACASCGHSSRCSASSAADSCVTCEEGYEIQVVYTDCTGYCVPEGTSELQPSLDICPGFYPVADCETEVCGGIDDDNDDDGSTSNASTLLPQISLVLFLAMLIFSN